MDNFIKILLSVFFSPKNYEEMRVKLAAWLFAETWIMTLLLRNIPSVDAAFRSAESFGRAGDILAAFPYLEKFNLGGVVVAVVIAGFSSAFELHNRISDLFGIRWRFDQNYILLPLADLVGAKLTSEKRIALTARREELMGRVFYPYTSSRLDNPLVDKHDIERALGAWSWYWLCIEAFALTLLGALVASFAADSLLKWFGLAFTVMFLFTYIFYFPLQKFARREIETIAADPEAKLKVRDAFNAL